MGKKVEITHAGSGAKCTVPQQSQSRERDLEKKNVKFIKKRKEKPKHKGEARIYTKLSLKHRFIFLTGANFSYLISYYRCIKTAARFCDAKSNFIFSIVRLRGSIIMIFLDSSFGRINSREPRYFK
jgi:hypothetical protein